MREVDSRLLAAIKQVTGKRPRTVLDHILKHGSVTTEELTQLYGYEHAPRAARDVREAGIPIETVWVKGSSGRRIASYQLGDPSKIEYHKLRGRASFSKTFKTALLERQGGQCAVCNTGFEERYLQIDHRVPYEIAGESSEEELDPDKFMLVCGTCNRRKSWSCEHCENFTTLRQPTRCLTCYWGTPDTDTYSHIALQQIRRLDLVWSGEEVADFDALRDFAQKQHQDMQSLVKRLLARRTQSQD